jgi:hypothetical protein
MLGLGLLSCAVAREWRNTNRVREVSSFGAGEMLLAEHQRCFDVLAAHEVVLVSSEQDVSWRLHTRKGTYSNNPTLCCCRLPAWGIMGSGSVFRF